MTTDQMQDVSPIVFDFVNGEQPDARKLTALGKQYETAFSKITKAIGDPWDYTDHGSIDLSIENLAQANLARVIGPSDFLSPRGGSFQNKMASFTVTLNANRTSWSLGFPLVKLVDEGELSPSFDSSNIVDLSSSLPSPDISFSADIDNVFQSEKSTDEEVIADGDYYINYKAGTIHSYSSPSAAVTLTINNLHMFGPGVPWGTHNVIPAWTDNSGCTVDSSAAPVGGYKKYTITLPYVSLNTYDVAQKEISLDPSSDEVIVNSVSAYGQGSKYSLPEVLNGLTEDTLIPTGFISVWDDTQARIIPLTTVYYKDQYSVYVNAPTGSIIQANGIRIITVGSNISESLYYLQAALRETKHNGLDFGAKGDLVHYTRPISHNDLADSYTGFIDPDGSYTGNYIKKLYFHKSNIPINPHPQYLHRTGYASDDLDGNSANSMRGRLVFSIGLDTSSGVSGVGDFEVSDVGPMQTTYGIQFGSGAWDAPIIRYGSAKYDVWSTRHWATRAVFHDIGASITEDAFGATQYVPWKGTPFYIRGEYDTSTSIIDYGFNGAALAFDLAQKGEMNYMKLLPADRKTSQYSAGEDFDFANQPAYTHTTLAAFNDILEGTPSLSNRLSSAQMREYRFRSAPYVSNAQNGDDGVAALATDVSTVTKNYSISSAASTYFSLPINASGPYQSDFPVGETFTITGSWNNGTWTILSTSVSVSGLSSFLRVYTTTTIGTTGAPPTTTNATVSVSEFNPYFLSPSILGSDYLNVYSNAIFFSDTGDGKKTSFTENGYDWLEGRLDGLGGRANKTPTGLYFVPRNGSVDPYFALSIYDSTYSLSTVPFSVGDEHGFYYVSTHGGDIVLDTDTGYFKLESGSSSIIFSNDDCYIASSSLLDISAVDRLLLSSGDCLIDLNYHNGVIATDQFKIDIDSSSGNSYIAHGALSKSRASSETLTRDGFHIYSDSGVGFFQLSSGGSIESGISIGRDLSSSTSATNIYMKTDNLYLDNSTPGGVNIFKTPSGTAVSMAFGIDDNACLRFYPSDTARITGLEEKPTGAGWRILYYNDATNEIKYDWCYSSVVGRFSSDA